MRWRVSVLAALFLLGGCDTRRFTLETHQTDAGLDVTVRNRAVLFDLETWNWSYRPCLKWITLISRYPVPDLGTTGRQPDRGSWTATSQTNACVEIRRFVLGRAPAGFAGDALKVVPGVCYELYVASPTEDVMGTIMLKSEADGRGGVRLVPLR